MSPVVTKLEKKDADICRAFRSIINQGEFKVRGDAAVQLGLMFRWFADLDKRIEETIKQASLPPPPIAPLPDPPKATEKRAKK